MSLIKTNKDGRSFVELKGIPREGGVFRFNLVASNGILPNAVSDQFLAYVRPADSKMTLRSTVGPSVGITKTVTLSATVSPVSTGGVAPTGSVTFEYGREVRYAPLVGTGSDATATLSYLVPNGTQANGLVRAWWDGDKSYEQSQQITFAPVP
jgi:hypothetical protein